MPGPNNRRMAERLGRQRQFVEGVRDDAEAAALVAKRGYDADEIAAGLALHAKAQTAYGGRDEATGATKRASGALGAADRHARKLLSEVRSTLTAFYEGQDDHLATLGVTRERLADDRDTFLTESRATLAAVRKAPYLDTVEGAGLDREAITAADESIAALATAAGNYGSSDGTAEASTDARDAAYAAFQTWIARFRRFARLAVRDHPAVAARVGM